eukprot:g24631.t1
MKPGSDPHECLKSKYSKVARTSYLADARSARSAALAQGVLPVRRFGFYFPVHDQVQGVVEVLKSARHFYPEAPIYMLQDGGSIDFGPLCRMQRFNCIFQRAPGENSRWNPHSWFARMRDATEILRSEYVIYLEPDVKITRRHHIDPKHDAGGVYDNFNPRMSAETKDYLDACLKLQMGNILRIDWQRLSAKEGDKTMSSDFAMLVALSARAWTDGSPRSVLSIPSRPPDAEGVNLNLARPSHCDGPRHVGSLLADPGYIRNAGIFMEAGPLWGTLQSRPRWLRSILATNRFHVRRYGHAMVIRWLPSQPQLLEWQRQQCGELSEKDCTQKNERENFNWEKHRMLEDCWHRSRMEGEERTFDRIYQEDDVFLFHPELVGGQGFSPVWLAKQDYLKSSQNFSYVMMLDADAALVRHEHDILAAMADQLTTHHRLFGENSVGSRG